jgi:hypothetical protein
MAEGLVEVPGSGADAETEGDAEALADGGELFDPQLARARTQRRRGKILHGARSDE